MERTNKFFRILLFRPAKHPFTPRIYLRSAAHFVALSFRYTARSGGIIMSSCLIIITSSIRPFLYCIAREKNACDYVCNYHRRIYIQITSLVAYGSHHLHYAVRVTLQWTIVRELAFLNCHDNICRTQSVMESVARSRDELPQILPEKFGCLFQFRELPN